MDVRYRSKRTAGFHAKRAQAIVEFALVLPILMMMLVGIFEVGRMIYTYAAVNNASREAVRFGSALGYDDLGNHKYKDCAQIKQAAKNSAYFTTLTVTISYDHGPGVGGSTIPDCTQPSGEDPNIPLLASGDRVLVSVSASYSPLIRLVPLPSRTFTSLSARTVLGAIEVASSSGGGGGGGGGSNTATATSAGTSAPTFTATATVPSNTPTKTATAGPIATFTPLPSSTPTLIPSSTPTATFTATATSTATATATATGTMPCTATPITLSATADTWVDEDNPSTTHGSDALLSVRSRNNKNSRAVVQFAIPSMPAGCKINTAILSLYVTSSTSSRTLQAVQVSSSWVEGTVNWNTQPTTSGSTANATVTGIAYLDWNVASLVQSMSTGTNNGFLIRDASESANGSGELQQFISQASSTNQPKLTITYTQAP